MRLGTVDTSATLLSNKLTALRAENRRSLQEFRSGILFAAFGFLEWKERVLSELR